MSAKEQEMMTEIVTQDEWLAARRALLDREKELTRARDEVSRLRRALPWARVDKEYRFETERGSRTLADLFDDRGHLIVYHFMFGPDWTEGCPSCSFWTDGWIGARVHLAHRDVALVLASRAPLARLLAYRERMGWNDTPWVSSLGSDFNADFGVSFDPAWRRQGVTYNYAPAGDADGERPGLSVFARGDDGMVFHTYSCYARGLDPLNPVYQLLDLTPKGRDEDELEWPMAWVRRHDVYQ